VTVQPLEEVTTSYALQFGEFYGERKRRPSFGLEVEPPQVTQSMGVSEARFK